MGRWGRWTLATLNVSIKRLGGTRRLLIAFPALCSSGAPNYSGSIRPENTAFRKKDRGEAQDKHARKRRRGRQINFHAARLVHRRWADTPSDSPGLRSAYRTHLQPRRPEESASKSYCHKKKKKEKSSSLRKSFHSKTLKTLEYEGGEGKKAELEFFTSCFLLCKYGHSG